MDPNLSPRHASWVATEGGPCAKKRLVESLKDPRVGQTGLASNIEQDKLDVLYKHDYCCFMYQTFFVDINYRNPPPLLKSTLHFCHCIPLLIEEYNSWLVHYSLHEGDVVH